MATTAIIMIVLVTLVNSLGYIKQSVIRTCNSGLFRILSRENETYLL
jgi:hypothetical protein